MAKDMKYIRKRKRKYGDSFLVDIPFLNENGEQKHFTQTVKIIDYGDEKTALIAAQRFRNEVLHDIQTGKLKRSYPTIKMLYQTKWQLMPLSITTHEKQDSIYKQSIIKIEDKYIDEVTITDIQLLLNEYAESHSNDGVKRLQTILRQIFKTARLLGYEIADLTESVIRPTSKIVTEKKPVDISDDDFQIILDGLLTYAGYESYNRRCLWFMLKIMYHTGMRPSEVLALSADDITDSYIIVNKRVGSTTKEKQIITPPKTESSNRKIPITPALSEVLDDLILWSNHHYLLSMEDGQLWDIDKASDTINKVAKKHGIKFNAYMLRHKMSTDLLHHGDPVIARDLLGHTSFSMTLDYARSTDEQIRDAMIQLSAENQPKNKSLRQPSEAMYKIYLIFRICALMRFLGVLRAFPNQTVNCPQCH